MKVNIFALICLLWISVSVECDIITKTEKPRNLSLKLTSSEEKVPKRKLLSLFSSDEKTKETFKLKNDLQTTEDLLKQNEGKIKR